MARSRAAGDSSDNSEGAIPVDGLRWAAGSSKASSESVVADGECSGLSGINSAFKVPCWDQLHNPIFITAMPVYANSPLQTPK